MSGLKELLGRAEFEKWCVQHIPDSVKKEYWLTRSASDADRYRDPSIQREWTAWQAAALRAREQAVPVAAEPSKCDCPSYWDNGLVKEHDPMCSLGGNQHPNAKPWRKPAAPSAPQAPLCATCTTPSICRHTRACVAPQAEAGQREDRRFPRLPCEASINALQMNGRFSRKEAIDIYDALAAVLPRATPPSDPGVPAEGVDAGVLRDAERYRYLRENIGIPPLTRFADCLFNSELDGAIDAVMGTDAALSAKESKP